MKSAEITVHTERRRGILDITSECAAFVARTSAGLLNVFVPHAIALLDTNVDNPRRTVRLTLIEG